MRPITTPHSIYGLRLVCVALAGVLPALGGCMTVIVDDSWIKYRSNALPEYQSKPDHKALAAGLLSRSGAKFYFYNWTWNHQSPEEAEKRALEICNQKRFDCQILRVDDKVVFDIDAKVFTPYQSRESFANSLLPFVQGANSAVAARNESYVTRNESNVNSRQPQAVPPQTAKRTPTNLSHCLRLEPMKTTGSTVELSGSTTTQGLRNICSVTVSYATCIEGVSTYSGCSYHETYGIGADAVVGYGTGRSNLLSPGQVAEMYGSTVNGRNLRIFWYACEGNFNETYIVSLSPLRGLCR